MPLNDLILSKRGPLAKVWLSAHHERKLSKQQALGVDVGETVGGSWWLLIPHTPSGARSAVASMSDARHMSNRSWCLMDPSDPPCRSHFDPGRGPDDTPHLRPAHARRDAYLLA